jgi:hypothetical protein
MNNILHNDSIPKGYFKSKYAHVIKKHGRFWLAHIPPEERRAFAMIGLQWSNYGRLGGVQRAKSAMRDCNGRFMKGECNE